MLTPPLLYQTGLIKTLQHKDNKGTDIMATVGGGGNQLGPV